MPRRPLPNPPPSAGPVSLYLSQTNRVIEQNLDYALQQALLYNTGLSSPAQALISSKLQEFKSVTVDFGAVGDGTTDDTARLAEAVEAALDGGFYLYWPNKTFLTTASIPDLHLVQHRGPGIIKRGTDLFYVEQKRSQTNKLYVAPTGDDVNDGLSASQPFGTIQAAVDAWSEYANTTKGDWTIDLAAGTYTEGCVVDGVISPTELVIEGKLSGSAKTAIIDGTSAALPHGINCNAGVRIRIRHIKVQDFAGASSSGIVFQNGTMGVIDTCDAENIGFAAFNATEYAVLDIIGNCTIDCRAAGQKGIRYYRQSQGSWTPGTGNALTINGNGFVTDGVEIRDNSYVVCSDNIIVDDHQNTGILVRRHSYIELRTATISNNAIGISEVELSTYANNTGVVTFTGNAQDRAFQGFSQQFGAAANTVFGATGPSAQLPTANYDLVVNAVGQTGLQFLTDSTTVPLNIDFKKLGRISYVLSDNSIRFTQNAVETWRMRATDLIPVTDNTLSFGGASNRIANVYGRQFRPGAGTPIWTSGTGTPEGAVTAPVGSLFTRTDGGAGTTMYVKESGAGNTGWVAK